MTIYLYVKTHNKTGLKYLGKTKSKDPHKYPGSGTYWKHHLKKHGKDYTTDILKECNTSTEVEFWGKYYSNLWNIVESKDWANLKPESGDGGGTPKVPRSEETRQKISNTLRGKKRPPEVGLKISQSLTGKHRSSDAIEKGRQSNIGRIVTEDTRLKISESNKKWRSTPEGKEAMSNGWKKRKSIL